MAQNMQNTQNIQNARNTSKTQTTAGIDVAYVARLARLELTDAETRLFSDQLQQVVDYVRELTELDTDGVEPLAHTADVCNVMRPDNPQPGLERDRVLAIAPRHDDEQFVVPRIF